MIECITVRESNGFYEPLPDTEDTLEAYQAGGAVVVQCEPLTGWGRWAFAVQLDGGEFAGRWLFVTAPDASSECVVCEGLGVMAPPCRRCAGDGWLTTDGGDTLAACPECVGAGVRLGPVPPCPVCQPVAVS